MKRKFLVVLIMIITSLNLLCCNNKNNTSEIPTALPIEESVESSSETIDDMENETDIEVDNEEIETKPILPLEIQSIIPYRDTDKNNRIEIEFNKEIADGFDALPYIKIEPSVDFEVSKVYNKLVLRAAFNSKQIYKLSILNGIKAIDNSETINSIIEEVAFEQKKPKIMFTNDGIILPSVNEKKVYVRSLNVTKVNVIVRKIYPNNTTQFLHKFYFKNNGVYQGTYDDDKYDNLKENQNEYYNNNRFANSEYYYDDDEYYDDYYYDSYYSQAFSYVGDRLYNVTFDIDNEIDTWVQSAIDLSNVIDDNGFYSVNVKFDEKGTSYNFPKKENGRLDWEDRSYLNNNGNISKFLLNTDVGIMAQTTDKCVHVNLFNIVDNSQIRGAKVYLMSTNNQILEEKTTNADGVVEFNHYKNSFYIYADNKNSKSVLVLKYPLSTQGFSVDGTRDTKGLDAYMYTERGVYRPGDDIYLGIIARNNGMPLKTNQPINITVYDPTGTKIIENDIIKDGINGFYTYNFKTDVSSKTGIWKLEATIGNKVIKKDISIETVVPNNIKVNINIPDVVNYDDSTNDWTINSNYLFGEPAKNLNYSVTFDIKEEPINFEKYTEYKFKAPTTYNYQNNMYRQGKLNNDGYANIYPGISDIDFGSVNMVANVVAYVTNDGGRNISSKKYVKIKKYDTYIGIENTNTYKKPGSNFDLKVICVSEDGENLVSGKNLKYRIYGNDYYWWLDYSNYNEFISSFKSDKNTILLKEGSFETTDSPYIIKDEVPNSEYLYVEVEDETTGQITGLDIISSDWVDSRTTKKIETLNIRTDKKKYSVGDVAEVSYKAAKNSKAIISIEKSGNIIDQFYRDVNNEQMTEKITITKDMAPNIYVYITILQNYMSKDNDKPLRLYGIIPLNVVDEDTKIDLEISTPEQIMPNEKFTVNIKNKNNKQFDFTIAVVDEGLLDLTAYKTPSPWDYFLQKIGASIKLFDNYSEIIDRPYGTVNQILKVGGDEAVLDEMARRRRLKELGLEDADRFTPVSMFKGVLTSDNNGNANVEFEMPNYMGQVRIMVIAANNNSYGSVDKDMIVKAPIIVMPTLPRSMKIGDKMSIPVSIFALEEGLGNIEVYYSFRDNKQTKNLQLNKGDKEIVYFEEETPNIVTTDKLTIGVKSNLYNYEETVGMAINTNNTYVEYSIDREVVDKNEITFVQDKNIIQGTYDGMITISNTMPLGLDKRLKYLIQYPYGCLEQTTSSVFPQLFIDKLSTAKNYDKAKIVNNINAGISRLKRFQLSNGSFSYWPGEKYTSDWTSNYAGHFLIYAKKNGYYVSDDMYNNWLNYLQRTVRKSVKYEYEINWKCYALYLLSLAGKANISEMNYMYENFSNSSIVMNMTSKMYLAAAYKLAGEETIAIQLAQSINTISIKNMFDTIFARDRYYYNYSYGSKLREVAVYLDCYYTIFGRNDKEAFDEIVNSLKSDIWCSTQTTAYSLLAISNIAEDNMVNELKGIIDIDGEITEYSTNNQYRMIIKEGVKNIKIKPDNTGKTYVNYYWEAVPLDEEINDYSEGFSISRHYYDNNGNAISAANTKSGDTFWLEVVVTPNKRNTERVENIALTQVLPSGWEIENLRLNDTNTPKWIKSTQATYTDIRDDRVMWFFNHNSNDPYKFYIKINSVTKGEFDLPGTTLEAMYDHDYRAFKKGSRVVVN